LGAKDKAERRSIKNDEDALKKELQFIVFWNI